METYKIVRYYREKNKRARTIAKGLTLAEARTYCQLPTTHKIGKTGELEWYDGFTQEE